MIFGLTPISPLHELVDDQRVAHFLMRMGLFALPKIEQLIQGGELE